MQCAGMSFRDSSWFHEGYRDRQSWGINFEARPQVMSKPIGAKSVKLLLLLTVLLTVEPPETMTSIS